MKQLRVVYVPVGGSPSVVTINNTLSSMQKLVDGYIEVYPFKSDMVIICDENAKLKDKDGNRRVGLEIIAGDFFVVGDSPSRDFVSLTNEQAADVMQIFLHPEIFTKEEVVSSMEFILLPFEV